jgi:penicillin-binding protein 2
LFALNNSQHEQRQYRLRLVIAASLILLAFCILLARLTFLQVLRYDHYQTLAENNRISLVPVVPNRGLIIDRNGVVLAENFFVYTLEITPSKVGNVDQTISDLSKLIEITDNDRKRFNKF